MPGNISYRIEFEGLDTNLVKLREMDRLLNNIGRKGGFGGGNGVNVPGGNGRGNTNVNVPPIYNSSNGAGAAETAGAAAAGASASSSSSSSSSKLESKMAQSYADFFSNIDNETWKRFRQYLSEFKLKGIFEKIHLRGQVNLFQKWFASQNSLPPGFYEYAPGLFRKGSPPQPPQYSAWQNAWAQIKTNASLTNEGGIGNILKGSGASPLSSALGSVINAFGFLKTIALELFVAFEALKFVVKAVEIAIKLLVEGIKHGAEAYQRGAKFGREVGNQFAIDSAFRAIGMETPDMLQLQGKFNPKSNKFEAPGTDEILGAARANQFGEGNQLLNMAKEFDYALKDAQGAAIQIQQSSKANQILLMDMTAVVREWNTLLSQTSSLFFQTIDDFLNDVKILFQFINFQMEKLVKWEQYFGLIPTGNTNFKNQTGGSGVKFIPSTSFGKLGFVIGGNSGPDKHLADINTNTRDTVKEIGLLRKVILTTIGMFYVNNHGIPSLP